MTELASLLEQIAEADKEWRATWSEGDCSIADETAALDKLDQLRADARRLVEQATGVPYDELQKAGL